MRKQLDRQCPGDHVHELVQGTATALSAMYSPYMAALIADVVIGGGRSNRNGQGEGNVNRQGVEDRTSGELRRVSRPTWGTYWLPKAGPMIG